MRTSERCAKRMQSARRTGLCAALVVWALAGMASGCSPLEKKKLHTVLMPSNHRDWRPELAVLPTGSIDGDALTIRNIRNCTWISEDDCILRHDDKTFELSDLRGVDFIVVPFRDAPNLAHTMLSFQFGDDDFIVVSVEARLERHQQYSPFLGALRQYELMYVIGDERDLIPLRTEHRDADVYVYRAKATPQESQALLVDIIERANKLAREPEFYDTLTNNCTTNIVAHVNRVSPGRIPLTDVRVLMPGHSDRLAFELGLLDVDGPFEVARQRAHINQRVRTAEAANFSQDIRR